MKKLKWDSRYLYAGITALLVILCCIVFFMLIQRWGAMRSAIIAFMGILSPFIWGFVIAYLLRPVMDLFQKKIFAPISVKISKKERTQFAFARGLSILLSVIFALFIIVTLLWLIIPRLYDSIQSIVLHAP